MKRVVNKFGKCCVFLWVTFFLLNDHVDAQIKDWNAGAGVWSESGNWAPAAVPQFGDLVRIGSLPGVQNSTVWLTGVEQVLTGLQMTDGMQLRTDGGALVISGETFVSGADGPGFRSAVIVTGNGGDYGLSTGQLSIENEGLVNLSLGGQLSVSDTFYVDPTSSLSGGGGQPGIVDLSKNGGTAMSLDGTISTGNALIINQLGTGLVDLDGTGSGVIDIVNEPFGVGTLAVHGTELADPFSGSIQMQSGSVLFMNLSDGWTADGDISVTSFFAPNDFARITGGDMEMTGALAVSSDAVQPAKLRIESVTTYQPVAQIEVGIEDVLQQSGEAVIEGGNFQLGQGGQLVFIGPTTIRGGTFNTHSNNVQDGNVDFTGATQWNGAATINGIASQNGESTVSGVTAIDANVFDMDGAAGSTTWNVNHTLNVNALAINSDGSNSFNGTLDVGVSFFSTFSINLAPEDSIWTMGGELNISNSLPFPQTRVGGSRMRLIGNLNADGAEIRILADTDFANGGTATFATPDTSLVMQGSTIVESGAMFVNEGQLINNSEGRIQLNAGASLNELSLLNRGLLEVGDVTGIADVAAFVATPGSRLNVEIGGYLTGDEYDVLLVGNGDAVLAGTLSVKLIDTGDGLFEPQIGDEFTVLSAVGAVIGQFENTPISIANGSGYIWDVVYNPHDITLRLSDIVPDVILGDVNQDGNVDLLDVAPFVEILTGGVYDVRADMNCDGVVDLLDVESFVAILGGS